MSATSNDVNDDVLKATKTYRQQRRHVIALYLLALLVMMVLFGWLLSEQYRQEIEAAESRITARANVVAEWAKGVFAQSGQALFGLAEMLTLQGMPDSDNAQALQRSLENLTLYVPMVDEIAVLSAEGRVMASGRSSRRAGADISDTTLFNAFKQAGQEELITPLYWSISDQRYYLYHGRRLETSSGEFAGVVISSIVPEVFADALEQMSVYDGESIALVDPGLKFIARYPTPEKPFSIGSQIESPETAEWLTRGESTWSINIDSPIDGRKRLFRMLRVGEYPMLAVVGVDLHELLSAWRQRALILMLVTAVIALLGAWGARHYLNRLALSHQLRQRIEEREQARAEAQIAAAAFQTHLGILITDPQGIILKVNETFSRITGYSEAEIVGNNPRMFSSGLQNAAFYRRLWKRVIKTGNWEGEIWNQRKNGELFPEWLTISAVYSVEGTLTHYVATMSDISERKAAEQEIHQLAFYDTLTGLANRRLFMDRIGNALKELQRHQRCGALLFIDIDNFKQINDTLGHYAGDQVLQSVARRMGQMLRDTDTLARLGSDEFAVLIEGVDSNYAQTTRLAERIAHKLLATLNESITLAEESITVTGSIGIAIMASNEYGVDDYLQQVDMALFQAKNNGRHGVCFFDPSMQAALLAHVKLEADLRQAQASQQWQLYYQPQVDHHGVITGVEALLRWHHPERGIVSPGDFIPLLESNELINDVGEWVLEDACYQLARWVQHPQLSKLTISVNISPLQFRDEQFLARVEGVFARTQAPLQRLKLEVTESLFVEARDDARDKMLALKARGVRFSLDDFGTGYSSLAYLAQLPLDQLKIDQSFVQQVLESQANAAIVESTIALAESLNLEVIAEGVETKAQQAWLLAHDCHAYQGYLFGRPVTAEAIERLITGA
ncbi:EAL domain-containing protein [Vreelandella titanicae]|uniref:bifunctional diguanylate cyclase/phosphodiesterase n=1 Tax=Vreelandella titanicae TaxID=664683 RepID=UPI00241DAA0B|nr:EAL domain-containing protein [Halomonas titanicae]